MPLSAHARAARAAATALSLVLALAPEAAAQSAPAYARAVDSVFAHLNRTDSPGCVVGISERGVPQYIRGYGMADLQHRVALSPDAIFHVASVSKQVTAFAVGLLAERGQLSLDDDVRKFIPELPEYGAPITVRQLIQHTSGLRDQWTLLSMSGWRFPSDLITERDVMQVVTRQRALNFRPGDEYLYSNSGYTLLAVIVQRVTGTSLRDFAHKEFFAPLGMHDTHFHDDFQMIVPGRTSAYEPGAPGWRISIPTFNTYGATSLFTTAGDLLKWMAMLDTPPAALASLARNGQVSGRLNDGTPTNYGYGLTLNTWRGTRAVGHGGSDAGYRAQVERYPEHGVAVAVLCNASNAGPGPLARSTAERVLGDRLPRELVEARAPEHRPAPSARARWVGTYRDTIAQSIMRVTSRGDSVYANGVRLQFGSDSTATTANMDGWYSLQPRGEQTTIRVNPRGLRQVTFVRQAEPITARAQYAGAYTSDELQTRYLLAVVDSQVVLSRPKYPDVTLQAAGRDVFSTPQFTLVFTRDRAQRITGFSLSAGRVRNVSFVKTP